MSEEFTFRVGLPVRKMKGYPFNGFIVACFHNRAGAARYVVEHATETGMLHIYSGAQLERRSDHDPQS